jgi:hypothetical protein
MCYRSLLLVEIGVTVAPLLEYARARRVGWGECSVCMKHAIAVRNLSFPQTHRDSQGLQ